MRYTSISGTVVDPTPVYWTFSTGDVMYPETWTSMSTGSSITSDSNVNASGSVTTTAKLLAQAGFRYSTNTTGGDPYGIVDILVAAKEA